MFVILQGWNGKNCTSLLVLDLTILQLLHPSYGEGPRNKAGIVHPHTFIPGQPWNEALVTRCKASY